MDFLAKYKLVIFDFDGTLANTYPYMLQIADSIASDLHYDPVSQNQLDELRELGVMKLIKKYKFPLWKIPEVAREIQTRMNRDIHQISLFDNMAAVLQQLFHHKVELALVSSNGNENIQKVLGKEIASYFSYFECGVSMFSKQAKFSKVLKNSGFQAEHALCIGDEIRDLQAARKVKIPFGAVAWGYTNIDKLSSFFPQEIFHSVCEISEKLLMPVSIP